MDPRALSGDVASGDDERFVELTSAERLEIFLQLCELTDSIVRGRPDADRIRAPTPRSAESEALWQRLIERSRRDRDRR